MDGDVSSTTDHRDGASEVFEVTHPFHPLFRQQFELVELRLNWGEQRAYFEDVDGRVKSLPARWTSVFPPDPVIVIGAGRAHFRVVDLLELSAHLQGTGR